MLYRTGIRSPAKYLFYDGKTGGIRLVKDVPEEGCYFCKLIRGSKQLSNYPGLIK